MEDLATIGSRLSPRAIWHLKQANETPVYEVILPWDVKEDERALMQLVDEILLILHPGPPPVGPDGRKVIGEGQCYTISSRGRQVLDALSSSEPQGGRGE